MSARRRGADATRARLARSGGAPAGRPLLFRFVPLVLALLTALMGISEELFAAAESTSRRSDESEITLDLATGDIDRTSHDAAPNVPVVETVAAEIVGRPERALPSEPLAETRSRTVEVDTSRFWPGSWLLRGPPVRG